MFVGETLARDVTSWLLPANPWKDYRIAHESRHIGTAEWFIQGNTFLEWKNSDQGALLWIHGKRPLLPNLCAFAEIDRFPSYSRGRKGGLLVC
jgi:hypothetical protein